jgi:hypothetical protein
MIGRHIREMPDLAKLPPDSRNVVGWLLAKEPASRPQRASALLPVLYGAEEAPAAENLDRAVVAHDSTAQKIVAPGGQVGYSRSSDSCVWAARPEPPAGRSSTPILGRSAGLRWSPAWRSRSSPPGLRSRAPRIQWRPGRRRRGARSPERIRSDAGCSNIADARARNAKRAPTCDRSCQPPGH